jgi:hypothetical protein
VRRGDIVKITHAFTDEDPFRVVIMENITEGATLTSRDKGVFMSKNFVQLDPPIMGRILSSQPRSSSCQFTLEEGVFISNVFVRSGEHQKGQDVLKSILVSQLNNYVKIWDTWISSETIRLLSSCLSHISIRILTENIYNEGQTKSDAVGLSRDIKIRKRTSLDHDRFILTHGSGWHVGHSLKDFGKKSSYLSRLESSTQVEQEFDNSWQQASIVI